MLNFCYEGEVSLSFEKDAFLLWQLLCLCVQYGLPAVFTAYVRSALVISLRDSRHAAVLPVLLNAANNVGLTPAESCLVADQFLSSPDAALAGVEGESRRVQVVLIVLGIIGKYLEAAAGQPVQAAANAQHPHTVR
jgi:hypothetical protein